VVQGDLESAAGVREGDILDGKYRVERVLGIGGMGVVVAAHHIRLNEKVALKFLLPEALGNADAVARFAREAQAAVKIKSEHVVRVTDVGTLPSGAPYMVMEYLDGGDLAAWIKQRGALPVEQAVEFILQASVAVADAHALGIVHRDLKPANLFCVRRSDGQLSIKVLDFGISKMTDVAGTAPALAMTRTATLMGTPLYMSPEQMRSSKDVNAQTDIWALGAILFELLAGRPAFLAESVTELAIKVNNEPPPSLRTFRPDVPEGLEAAIFKCLEKDFRQRYRNVAVLALALLPFAPRRAKASVERISGIIQAAGPSASALAVPPSPSVEGTQVYPGTLPPVGRTTTGATGKSKTARMGAGVAGAVVLIALAGFVRKGFTEREGRQAEAGHPATTAIPEVSQPVPTIEPPKPPETTVAAPQTGRSVDLPSATPALPDRDGAPQTATTAKTRVIPPVHVASATTPPTQAALAPVAAPPPPSPPPPAKCDPPYYYDARGNRVFKPECPL
jgi:serine/threonine protein kinase